MNHNNGVPLDAEQVADVRDMFRSSPSLRLARTAFLAMTVCGPFTLSVPRLGIQSNEEMEHIINQYWLPWQRGVVDHVNMLGLCPFYIYNAGGHPIPVIPELDLGVITVSVTARHQLRYRWFWTHDNEQKEEKQMFWILTDESPSSTGKLRSRLSALLAQYRSLRLARQAQDTVVVQQSEPTHIFEYRPKRSKDENDHLTRLNAQFGSQLAGTVMAREAELQNERVVTDINHFRSQLDTAYRRNRGLSVKRGSGKERVAWTDHEAVTRNNPGFVDRSIVLDADFHYVSAATPRMALNLAELERDFGVTAAAILGFPMELVQATGRSRLQSLGASERFGNEMIKATLQFLRSVTRAAVVVAYRRQLMELMEDTRHRYAKRNGVDPRQVAALYPELEVDIHMSCTPMADYKTLQQFVADGIMARETFAAHAFHMYGLPADEIEISTPQTAAEPGRKMKP